MRDGLLIERIEQSRSAPDPTGSADFDLLRVARKKFSRGGLPAQRRPEDDARIAVFCVLKPLLELLAEFSRRIRRGERVRLVSKEQPRTPGRMVLEVAIESAEHKEGW